jgi:hypothetical protein
MATFEDFLRAQTPTVFARPEPPPPPLPMNMGMPMGDAPLAAGLNPGGVYIPPQMEGMLPPMAPEAPPVPPMPMVGEVMPETKPVEPVDMGYTMPEQFDTSTGIYDDYIGARNRGMSMFSPMQGGGMAPAAPPMGSPFGMQGPRAMMQGPATTRAIEAGLGAMEREREFATRFPRATEALNRYGGLPSQHNPARGAGPTAPALTRPRGY